METLKSEENSMSCFKSAVATNQACAVVMLMLVVASTASARPGSADRHDAVGRVDFDFPNAPPATVEVDLGEGMLSDLTGIAQAAIGGIVEGLLESAQGREHGAVQLSAEHLASAQKIVESVSGVVREIRVRVYDHLPESGADVRSSMTAHYQQKVLNSDWDNLVRVHDGDTNVNVCALRRAGAIRGLYVMVSEDDQFVLVNVVCDLSPEMVKQVTKQATQIGLQVGLEQALQEAMREMGQDPGH
jgi:hypothetical protein